MLDGKRWWQELRKLRKVGTFNDALHCQGNLAIIEGTDIVEGHKGKKVAVFCDSEFWHGYNWEKRKNDFKTNQDFWIPKIERNIQRDAEVNEKLAADGWTVLRFWGNEIKKNCSECADIIEKALKIEGKKETI